MRSSFDTKSVIDGFLDIFERCGSCIRAGAVYLRQVFVIDLYTEVVVLAQVNPIVQINLAGQASSGCI